MQLLLKIKKLSIALFLSASKFLWEIIKLLNAWLLWLVGEKVGLCFFPPISQEKTAITERIEEYKSQAWVMLL